MKSHDLQSGSFLLVLGLIIIEESLRLHIGTPQEPGAGFYPMLTGIAIAGLALLLLTTCLWSGWRKKSSLSEPAKPVRLKKMALTVGALLAYAFTLEALGFLLATFFLMIFMLRVIEPMKWKVVLLTASLTAVGCYLLFDVFLQAQMPAGLLRYFL
jgi:putative tricarboxylic transport membrane protein